MTTLHLVRPELRSMLADFPMPEMNPEFLATIRAGPAGPLPPSPDVPGIKVEERWIPGFGTEPEVRVLIYRPMTQRKDMPAILHVHGGGFVAGTPEISDASNRSQADTLEAVILSVDYRLAPEHPFPGPLYDCYAALLWLHANAAELGVDPARIMLKGESAGGGLAAGLALFARDRAEVPIHFQCLTFPMLDDRSADAHPYTGEFVWTPSSNRFAWSCYLGQEPGGADVSPYAAAARADDLSGLAPALIITAALDLFVEENLEYARRLLRAGVPVELIVYPGAYHGFQMAGDTELNRRYQQDVMRGLKAALAG